MKLNKSTLIYLLVFIQIHALHAQKTPYTALVQVAVADLSGESLASNIMPTEKAYDTVMPLESVGTSPGSARAHQALFHEPVTVLEERREEVRIQLSSIFFQNDENSKKQSIFWTLKKNVLPLSAITPTHMATTVLPPAIDHTNPQTLLNPHKKIVTLNQPFQDKITNLTFSAGTRFMLCPFRQSDDTACVYLLDPAQKTIRTTLIPRTHLIAHTERSAKEKRKQFVELIQSWAHQKKGFIPYVKGGASFTHATTSPAYKTKKIINHRGQPASVYIRPQLTTSPRTGFDCSGVIARAAHITGIPYFYKNTTTLEKNLSPITQLDTIKPGDLIWFQGHVMIITDPKNNLIAESRTLDHGFGKLHEASVDVFFKGIKTIEQLKQKFLHNKSLLRLDANGKVVQTIGAFKILRLPV